MVCHQQCQWNKAQEHLVDMAVHGNQVQRRDHVQQALHVTPPAGCTLFSRANRYMQKPVNANPNTIVAL